MSDLAERLRAALAGRYDVAREIGAGGMATVYLAQDLRHDRKVAIKVLRPELAGGGSCLRCRGFEPPPGRLLDRLFPFHSLCDLAITWRIL